MAILRIVLLLSAFVFLSGCVRLTLAWTDLSGRGPEASPTILQGDDDQRPVTTPSEWESQQVPAIKAALETYVYGEMPDAAATEIVSHTVRDEAAFGGIGRFEEYVISATATFNRVPVATKNGSGAGGFIMAVVSPSSASGPVPVILMETFCPRWNVLPHPNATAPADATEAGDGFFGSVATFVFGRFICTPPIEEILGAGYAIAVVFPSEIVADHPIVGLSDLQRLSAGHEDDETRWGAVAAWGWVYSRMIDVLEQDDRFDQDAMIAWGHSRYGKAALVAAAFDARIDGVISHQSGTGGASLNRRKKGESVGSITENYPHWFSKKYADYAGREEDLPLDQHQLLGLIAPRPVLLGNARRDVWSDPNGAFRAAVGADPVYELYGRGGLEQDRLRQFNPSADLSFWIRPGTHGVVEEDWPAFLAFLDAHFKAQDGS